MIKKEKTKKTYSGVAIREFSANEIAYIYGDKFETSSKKQFDNLINNKRIK